MNFLSIRVWQGFAAWRSQLYRTLSRIDRYYLMLLRDELQRVIEDIEHELTLRP